MTIGQGVGMSGIPLWTTDIGGYGGGDPASADFQELIVRWFQFGAFCPLFRLQATAAAGRPRTQSARTRTGTTRCGTSRRRRGITTRSSP